jgi:acetyl esterase/lipase
MLDVFVPNGDDLAKPVVMYVHGGGFFSGDKMWTEKVYSNIGWFFAHHGIITVVVNHRLVPHVQYPGGADDMQLAREWIYNHISSAIYGHGSVDKVVLFGHSSGGAHVAMNLYSASKKYFQCLEPTHGFVSVRALSNIGDILGAPSRPLFPPVAGVIYLSVPFWYDRRKPMRQKTIRSYYGSDSEDVWGVRLSQPARNVLS